MTTKSKKVPLLVTTDKRGVFFGYGVPTTDTIIRLENAQMCIYWSANVGGVLGLAASGPLDGCKISPVVPATTLQGVVSVTETTKEAETRWTTFLNKKK